MADYEALYKQSLLQIQKQKEQIKKLEQEIRQRCQSYLIHSSRYRSKKNQNTSDQTKKNAWESRVDSQSAAQPAQAQLKFVSNAVNITYQNHQPGISQQTQTLTQNQTKQLKAKSSAKINNLYDQNVQCNDGKNVGEASTSHNIQKQTSIEQLRSLKSNESSVPESSLDYNSQQRVLERQNSHPQINWEQIVTGLKQRITTIQKQKSDQAQRVIDLEQQIRGLKKQKSLADANNASMKKKATRSIEYRINNEVPIEQQIEKILQDADDQLSLNDCPNTVEKVKNLVNHTLQLKRKVEYFQLKEMEESKVQSYQYNTPYRKIKAKQNQQDNETQIRDHYEQSELENLRNKLKQLQMELSKSREQKFCSPEINRQLGQEQNNLQMIQHGGPLIVEQELQKPNSPYVKRSFVRKKVVKRNLSAMILRSPSKSKQQSKTAMLNQLQKLKSHLQKSKDSKNEKQVRSLSRKIERIEKSIEPKQAKIDQISDEESSIARTSGASQGFTEIIQVETEGPGYKNYTAHILGLSRKDRSTHERKQNNY